MNNAQRKYLEDTLLLWSKSIYILVGLVAIWWLASIWLIDLHGFEDYYLDGPGAAAFCIKILLFGWSCQWFAGYLKAGR
ncbi:hypothetical protein ACTJKS_15065 [Pseudomonas sp. 22189]|uniref:hypothetical protein n=1 Tax=Pseudomonas sp. 22189 TaxID=3453889 RepID=UPI003F848757